MKQAYLAQFDHAILIAKGMSGDEKYRVERGGRAFLLRVSDGAQYEEKQRDFARLMRLNRAGLPVPECISFGKAPEGDAVLTLLSWVEGDEAEAVLPRMTAAGQYDCGLQAGRILRQIHENSAEEAPGEDWHDRYFGVLGPRLEAFREKGIRFDGSEAILQFIEENRALLKDRPMCGHHGDFHAGNLIIRDEKMWVIDWQSVDFANIGDPWYEFNRIETDCPMFAKGQIDGYFGGPAPEEFWRLFALYLAAGAITSVVWAMRRGPELLEEILERNRQVLAMFDGMKNPVPAWYRA